MTAGSAGKAGAGGLGAGAGGTGAGDSGAGGTGAGGTGAAAGTSGAGAASGKGGTSGAGGSSGGGAAGLVDDTCRVPVAGSGGVSGSGGASASSGSGGVSGSSGGGASGSSGGGASGSSGSGGGCVAPIAANALYSFDDASAVHVGKTDLSVPNSFPPGWFAYGQEMKDGGSLALQESTTDWSATEGHFCPGALTLTANFTVYGPSEKVATLLNFPVVMNWATPIEYTRMHAWLKVRLPSTCNLNHLSGVQIAVNSNGFAAFNSFGPGVATFADGQWHEVILPLKPPIGPYVPAIVNQLNIQMTVPSVAPVGARVAVRTTLLIDDIWLERP
jgi:hypothetical protein